MERSHAEDAVGPGGSIARRSAADSQAAAQHVAGVTRILSAWNQCEVQVFSAEMVANKCEMNMKFMPSECGVNVC